MNADRTPEEVGQPFCKDEAAGDKMSTQRTVIVWGKPQVVSVDRKSKSVWIAVGDYMGEPIAVQDRSEGAALKRWREAATYKGN
jgi:hypothetical protein